MAISSLVLSTAIRILIKHDKSLLCVHIHVLQLFDYIMHLVAIANAVLR